MNGVRHRAQLWPYRKRGRPVQTGLLILNYSKTQRLPKRHEGIELIRTWTTRGGLQSCAELISQKFLRRKSVPPPPPPRPSAHSEAGNSKSRNVRPRRVRPSIITCRVANAVNCESGRWGEPRGRTRARSARYGGLDNGPGNGRGRNASPRSAGIANFGRGCSRETSGIMGVFFLCWSTRFISVIRVLKAGTH